jgi:hypothetical protein
MVHSEYGTVGVSVELKLRLKVVQKGHRCVQVLFMKELCFLKWNVYAAFLHCVLFWVWNRLLMPELDFCSVWKTTDHISQTTTRHTGAVGRQTSSCYSEISIGKQTSITVTYKQVWPRIFPVTPVPWASLLLPHIMNPAQLKEEAGQEKVCMYPQGENVL